MTAPRIITFGCRLNAYESEVMRANAACGDDHETVIVNTCAVTSEATRQARQAIRKARRESPRARIVVTGCAAQVEPDSFAAMDEVDLVLGNEEKLRPESFATPGSGLAGGEKVRVEDIFSATKTAGHLIDGFEGKARAFVQIQNGCNHRCTFCIIPFGRGNSRSVPVGDVIRQVERLVGNGYREIVLTGVDITAYGADLPGQPRLGTLVRRILERVADLPRLRISSIDSVEADDDLLRAIAEDERLMPHLHLSLQSGDDMILKRMKRRHLRADSVAFCADIRRLRPDIVLGADLIAGFPTETEGMFGNTLDLVDDCGLTFLHVFPFSARPGTPAALMPQVDGPVIAERARRLREAGARALRAHLDRNVGTEQPVLVERPRHGRTAHFAHVRFAEHHQPGTIVTARLTAHDGREFTGARAA